MAIYSSFGGSAPSPPTKLVGVIPLATSTAECNYKIMIYVIMKLRGTRKHFSSGQARK